MAISKKIKLVLSGSGCLYPVHVGAILRLAEAGYIFEQVCGTSGGSIVAAALATGYPPNHELVKMIKNTLPAKNGLIDMSIFALTFNWGLIKGDRIEKVFNKHFVKKMSETKIPLHVVTTNLDKQEVKVFSTKNDPNMSVATAVRASMSIPGVFTPVRINGDLHVDGGIMANYFLDLFGTGDDVIGLKFKSVSDDKKGTPIKNPAQYVERVIDSLIQGSTNEHMDDATFARTILLETKHNGMDFNMTETDVDDMLEEGYNSADSWLKLYK